MDVCHVWLPEAIYLGHNLASLLINSVNKKIQIGRKYLGKSWILWIDLETILGIVWSVEYMTELLSHLLRKWLGQIWVNRRHVSYDQNMEAS